jgi:hypothetical protein
MADPLELLSSVLASGNKQGASSLGSLSKVFQNDATKTVSPKIGGGYLPSPPQEDSVYVWDNAANTATGRKSFTGTYNANTARKVIDAAKRYGVDPKLALSVSIQESGLGRYDPNNPMRVYGSSEGEFPELKPYNKKVDEAIQVSEDYDKVVAKTSPKVTSAEREIMAQLQARYKQKIDEASRVYENKKSELGYDDTVNLGVRILKHKMEQYSSKPIEKQIQAYNGFGKISTKYLKSIYGTPKVGMYGQPAESIDTRENPVYGHRVIDIYKNVVEQSPDLLKMINEDEQ